MPTVLTAVESLVDLSDERVSNSKPSSSKKAGPLLKASNETRKSLLSFAKYFAPEIEKVYNLEEMAERSSMVRTLATSTPRRVAWRDFRGWLVGEGGEWEAGTSTSSDLEMNGTSRVSRLSEEKGTLKIQGWIRGAPISANRLVHIPDFGDFKVDQIRFKPVMNEKNGRRFEKLRKEREESEKNKGKEEVKDEELMEVENPVVDPGQQQDGDETSTIERKDLLPDDLLEEREEGFADDLVSENEVDELANEQTWPTEEEMKGHLTSKNSTGEDEDGDEGKMLPPALPGTTPFKIEKQKGGTRKGEGILSEKYKAAWIVESDEEDGGEEEEDSDELDEDQEMGMVEKEPETEDLGIITGDEEVQTEIAFDEDEEEYQLALKAYEEERARMKSEREDLNFPDEVDTPVSISARKRFERFRGLKSFRTSPWDPYEDLPMDYAKIFQFDDWKRSKKRVEADLVGSGVRPGTRVEIWIKDVPKEAARRAGVKGLEKDSGSENIPFTLFGLMRHEHKKSVMNFTCTRNTEFEGTVKSKVSQSAWVSFPLFLRASERNPHTDSLLLLSSLKPTPQDPLILSLGPRRFKVNPIFSQHTRSSGSNNVHKFERFLRPGVGSVSVCSIFAPVTFGSPSAVLFKERSQEGVRGYDQRGVGARQMPHLVGSGNLLGAEPTRINAKRIVLTGHPFKVHKKTATIRFMFFNPGEFFSLPPFFSVHI